MVKINKYGSYVFGDIRVVLLHYSEIHPSQISKLDHYQDLILQFSELFHQAEPLSFNHATFNTLDTLKALEDFHGQAIKP